MGSAEQFTMASWGPVPWSRIHSACAHQTTSAATMNLRATGIDNTSKSHGLPTGLFVGSARPVRGVGSARFSFDISGSCSDPPIPAPPPGVADKG